MTCPWCKFNKSSCDGVEETCDFKSLPYEKDAILARIKQEYEKVQELKKGRTLESYKDIVDKVAGIQIMTERLKEDFGVEGDEVRKLSGVDELSTVNKLKLSAKLKVMQHSRGGKPVDKNERRW